jgi:hypothetical protein
MKQLSIAQCYATLLTEILVMTEEHLADHKSYVLSLNILIIHRLKHYGITGKTNEWNKNFLSDRTQSVVVEGETSTSIPVESGVPQGSVLGPSLFLFDINDMPDGIQSTVRLFADDTIAYVTISSDADAANLQQDLDKLAEWE